MLIILPSSEGKSGPTDGPPLDLATIAFPTLTAHRRALIDAVAAASEEADAPARFGLSAARRDELDVNRALATAPTATALSLYTGVVHRALDAVTLTPAARRRAAARLVIASSLYGLLRPDDRIAPYRLPIGTRLPNLPSLAAGWRELLPAVLDHAAGGGLVVDLRAGSYQAAGLPSNASERVVTIRLAPGVAGGSVALKQMRGRIARELLVSSDTPHSAEEFVRLLAGLGPLRLVAGRPGAPLALHYGRG